jgi:hypothetical protein
MFTVDKPQQVQSGPAEREPRLLWQLLLGIGRRSN